MKRFSLNISPRPLTLDELSSVISPEFVSRAVLDLLPVGETVWNGIGTKITRLPDEEDRSKKGIWVAIKSDGIVVWTAEGLAANDYLYNTSLTKSNRLYNTATADRIIFIAEDGSVRLVKDRYQIETSLLPAFPR